jgi:hypothetical protein
MLIIDRLRRRDDDADDDEKREATGTIMALHQTHTEHTDESPGLALLGERTKSETPPTN